MMKWIGAGLLGVAALCGGVACAADVVPVDVEEIDGGTRDTSVRHKTPVVIESRDIESFRLTFEFSDDVGADDATKERYPVGRYDLRLEKSEDGARCYIEWWNRYGERRKTEFVADAGALARLDAILKLHDVAQIDGHSLWNSAQGDDMDLSVRYTSGETINASGQGGDVKPDGRYYQETWFIDFFRELAREYGKDVLAPRIVDCSYRISGGMSGYSYELRLYKERKGGAVHLDFSSEDYNGAGEKKRSYELTEEVLDQITAIVNREDMRKWDAQPMSEVQALDADRLIVSVAYSNGESVCVSDDQELPKEAYNAFRRIRTFLESLDTDRDKE